MYNARPNADRKVLLVAVDRSSMKVCFWPDMAVVAVENPTYMKNLIYTTPVDSEGIVRQQQPSGSNLAFISAHVDLCCVGIDCVSMWMPVRLNIRSQLETNYFPPPPRKHQWFCLISILSQANFDGPWQCKDACPTCSCWTYLCCGPSYHITKFGHGVFLQLYTPINCTFIGIWLLHYKHTQAFPPTLYKGLNLFIDINLPNLSNTWHLMKLHDRYRCCVV
jgi:hypothetical protein